MGYLIDAHCDALVLTHSASTINDRRRCLRRLHRDLRYGVAFGTTVDILAWLANPAWSDATRYTYAPCRAGTEVVLWKLTGAGHVWPGGHKDYLPLLLGAGTTVLDANAEMWRFFSRFHRGR